MLRLACENPKPTKIMEVKFSNAFMTIYVDVSNTFFKTIYLKETESMTEEEFKDCILKQLDTIIKNKLQYCLSDATYLLFPLTPTIQEWVVQNFALPATKHGLRKVAVLLPTEFIANLSAEQAIDDINQANGHITHYFGNENEAMQWLLS